MYRVYGRGVGRDAQTRASVTDPPWNSLGPTPHYLEGVGLPTRPPPIAAARPHPKKELEYAA